MGTAGDRPSAADVAALCHDRPDEELVEGTARLAAAWSETAPGRMLP